MAQQLEIWIAKKMRNVLLATRKIIIDAQNVMMTLQQLLA